MSIRRPHVPPDRLTGLALGAGVPADARDREALSHVARCDRCALELSRLTTDLDELRGAALAEADVLFPDTVLEQQRSRILDRIAHLGQMARVLRFPVRTREEAMPVPNGSRRWISVSAAAGLIIGLLAGQLMHWVPWQPATTRDVSTSMSPAARPGDAGIVPAATTALLSDEELLNEVEAAVQLRRASALMALDALTPIAADQFDLPPGR